MLIIISYHTNGKKILCNRKGELHDETMSRSHLQTLVSAAPERPLEMQILRSLSPPTESGCLQCGAQKSAL